MKVKRYKSTRKYRCPYCRITATREKLVSHIDKEHQSMLPEGYSAAHALYDYINKKNYGTCLICKKKIYEWDDNICRYKNICDNPECMKQIKARAQLNHLDDPEVQKKMLANRKISGQYTFHDGVTHSYVGSYERNCFEFMDTVLNIPGRDIMSPGPTIYYKWNGETHPWILDWMYIPAMLCCDVKDGGSNPNNRPMEDYRSKQLAKEEAIAKSGEYNYLRLTDNNFGQLLSALADIRYGVINHDPINHIYINESVGGIPSHRGMSNDYIIPHMMDNVFDRQPIITFGNTGFDTLVTFDVDNTPKFIGKDDNSLCALAEDYRIILPSNILPTLSKEKIASLGEDGLIQEMTGKPYTGLKNLLIENKVKISADCESDMIRSLILNGIVANVSAIIQEKVLTESKYIQSKGDVSVYQDDDGYYLRTPEDFLLQSAYYALLTDIPDSVYELMNALYANHKKRGDQQNAV